MFVRNQLLEEEGEEEEGKVEGEVEGEVNQDIPMAKIFNLFVLDVSNSIRKRYFMSRLHGLVLVLAKSDCIWCC